MIGMPPAPGMAFIITRHVPPDRETIPDAAPECAEMGPEACLGLQLHGYQGWVSMNTGSAFSLFLPLRAAMIRGNRREETMIRQGIGANHSTARRFPAG